MIQLLEYEGERLLEEAGISVPGGHVASIPTEARRISAEIDGPVAIKAQIGAKGRCKASVIKFVKHKESSKKQNGKDW